MDCGSRIGYPSPWRAFLGLRISLTLIYEDGEDDEEVALEGTSV